MTPFVSWMCDGLVSGSWYRETNASLERFCGGSSPVLLDGLPPAAFPLAECGGSLGPGLAGPSPNELTAPLLNDALDEAHEGPGSSEDGLGSAEGWRDWRCPLSAGVLRPASMGWGREGGGGACECASLLARPCALPVIARSSRTSVYGSDCCKYGKQYIYCRITGSLSRSYTLG